METAAAYSVGIASYYSNSLHGRKTASGEVYDKDKLTAAHKTLPFQTKVEVRNTKNSRTVVVVINDRLPQTNKREIDLSEEAAKSLDMMKDGIVEVELRLLK
ncbi:MAG TPA: septal ring lytic transglycosylase RlpA family lipoprotein [Microscillaceae bacterium]|nr:septal ring lytic transglycosylase RlpA family lipoprotein [Microscillaceae bacterium]